MLRIVSVSEPFFALSIIYTGALRGARDVRFPMVVGLIAMWGVRIPLAPLLVFVFKLGLAGVWIAMAADLILRGILCTLRWRAPLGTPGVCSSPGSGSGDGRLKPSTRTERRAARLSVFLRPGLCVTRALTGWLQKNKYCEKFLPFCNLPNPARPAIMCYVTQRNRPNRAYSQR